MTLRTLLVCGWFFLIGGCANTPYDRLRSFDGPEAGVVVASVGKNKKAHRYSSTFVQFRLRGTDDRGTLTYGPRAYLVPGGASPKDIDTDENEGTVVVKQLPPGTYDIYWAAGVSHAGVRTLLYERQVYPPISFTIKAGEVTYVGRYLIGQRSWAKTDPTLALSSEPDFDLPIAKTRAGKFKWPSEADSSNGGEHPVAAEK